VTATPSRQAWPFCRDALERGRAALEAFELDQTRREKHMDEHDQVSRYVELEARENVVSAESVGTFSIDEDEGQVWKVKTTDGLWWVVSGVELMNLYPAKETDPDEHPHTGFRAP
jgi:hypothetical protein